MGRRKPKHAKSHGDPMDKPCRLFGLAPEVIEPRMYDTWVRLAAPDDAVFDRIAPWYGDYVPAPAAYVLDRMLTDPQRPGAHMLSRDGTVFFAPLTELAEGFRLNGGGRSTLDVVELIHRMHAAAGLIVADLSPDADEHPDEVVAVLRPVVDDPRTGDGWVFFDQLSNDTGAELIERLTDEGEA